MEAPKTNNGLPNDILLQDLISNQAQSSDEKQMSITPVQEEEKSPLEKMREYNSTHSGTVVNNSEITYSDKPAPLKNSMENDKREEEFNQYVTEMDSLIDAAESVKITNPPKNPIEAVAMIDQLDRMAKEKSGHTISNPRTTDNTIIELPKEEKEGTDLNVPGTNGPVKFFEKLSDEEAEKIKKRKRFILDQINAGKSQEEIKKALIENGFDKDPNEVKETSETGEEKEVTSYDETEHHENLVKILIDKTGFGNDRIDFNEEEREKLTAASEIRVVEVENLEMESFTFEAPEKSYMESQEDMLKESDFAVGTTIVPLVASRYRARMKGLGYGQLGDLIINPQSPKFEQYHKSYSVIYNSIVSTSIHEFKNFEDFLKNTAFMDMDTLLYGLVVSTYPEVDTIGLECRRCGRQFEHQYITRDLMDLKHADTKYLENLNKLMSVPSDQFEKYAADGPLHKRKLIRLPNSKYYIEFGLASAYDYLYQVIGNLMDPAFALNHKDDINGIMQMNAVYLGMIRSISIEKTPGHLVRYESFEDMIQMLYYLPPDDLQILIAYLAKYNESYSINFSVKNSTCPNCGLKTPYSDVNMQDIIFFKFQLLMSTEVSVANMLDL